MKHLKLKAAVISAFAAMMAFWATTTAFAESSETHEVSATTSEGEGNSDTSNTSEESSTPRVSENPQLRAELQNDELYNYLMQYLNDPENFSTDGSGVLIDESILNPNADTSNTSVTNSYTVSSNGEKVMYTVATRDGSIFYIIVDKSGDTENVYFLNTVDAVDLAAIIKSGKTESDTYTPQELEIIAQAEEAAKKSAAGSTSDTSNLAESNATSQGSSAQSQGKKSDTSIYIIVGVVAVAIIGIAAYKKIGPGKKKKAPAFDELPDDDDEDDEAYSEDDYYEEQEEVGNFDDDDG